MPRAVAFLFAALVAFAATLPHAFADTVKDGNLVIENAWARATPPNAKTAAIYMTMRNEGSTPFSLVKADTSASGMTMLHNTVMEKDVMKMKHMMRVAIEPGKTATFEPGGMHIMLMSLNRPLIEGETLDLTLSFKKREPIALTVPIKRQP